jgi:hypothetical protein
MIEYKAFNNGLGVDEMVGVLMNRTWKSPRLNGLEGLIQKQNEQLLLTYLLAASVSTSASFATKAAMTNAINDIKTYAEAQLKITKDEPYKGYLLLALERIKAPETAKPTMHLAQPPGSPIGDEDE